MMKATMVMAAFAAAISAQGEVELSAAADRVESPLRVDMKCVGTLAPRSVKDIRSSNWTLGCETLDRDFASVFDDTLSRVRDSSFGTKDMTLFFYEYRKEDGRPVFAFWTHAEEVGKIDKSTGVLGEGEYAVITCAVANVCRLLMVNEECN